jgi:hypothetical protein
MSDYDRGYQGLGREEDTSDLEYNRGVQDRLAGNPPDGGGWQDLPRVRAAWANVGEYWAHDPHGTLASMVKVLTGFTIVGAIIGLVLGVLLGDAWTKTGPLTWGVNFAYVSFWVFGFMIAAGLIGVSLVKPTKRGTLVLVILLASLVFMLWTFVSWRMYT